MLNGKEIPSCGLIYLNSIIIVFACNMNISLNSKYNKFYLSTKTERDKYMHKVTKQGCYKGTIRKTVSNGITP